MTRQAVMNELYFMLSNNFRIIEPDAILRYLEKLKKLWNPATHTRTNIENIIDQIELLWEAGTLNRQLLGFLLTNLIYDNNKVTHIRRIISLHTRDHGIEMYNVRTFYDAI